jgi:hypothetical protein
MDQGYLLIRRGLDAVGTAAAREVAAVMAKAIVAHAKRVDRA